MIEKIDEAKDFISKLINNQKIETMIILGSGMGGFEENYDPSIPAVNGDFELLTQAFHNLIKNSCEAVNEKGGRINIKTSFYSGMALGSFGEKNKKLQLLISIADNGPGVSRNIIADIFDPFK